MNAIIIMNIILPRVGLKYMFACGMGLKPVCAVHNPTWDYVQQNHPVTQAFPHPPRRYKCANCKRKIK